MSNINRTVFDDLLGDAQGGEGLARAACHDEAAPVVVGKSVNSVLDRLFLKGPRLLHRPFRVLLFDLDVEILPKVDLRDLGMSVLDSSLRVRASRASARSRRSRTPAPEGRCA